MPGGPPTAKEYGKMANKGDRIGVIFEFKNNIGHLSFLKNGVSFTIITYFHYRHR